MGLLGGLLKVGGSLLGLGSANSSADKAAQAQVQAAQLGIDETRRQFNQTENNLSPWLQSGTAALSGQNDLLGLGGGVDWEAFANSLDPAAQRDYQTNWSGAPGSLGNMSLADYGKFYYTHDLKNGQTTDPNYTGHDLSPFTTTADQAQQAAIDKLKASPLYQSLFSNGQNTILSNASATGGLRGGNTQTSLANFGRDTLAQVIQQQLSSLGGVAANGQNAAAQTGAFGANSASQAADLLGQQGSAQAGASLAKGANTAAAINAMISGASDVGSSIPGLKGLF